MSKYDNCENNNFCDPSTCDGAHCSMYYPCSKTAEIIEEVKKGCFSKFGTQVDPSCGDWCKDLEECKKETKKINDRVSKDNYYVDIALAVSKRSTCLKRHYGCIIVKNDEIISTGYNGAPRGKENCCDRGQCPRLGISHNSGDYSLCPAVHSEQNAMLSASRKDMIGATMYLAGEDCTEENWDNNNLVEIKDCEPCPICKGMIANAGILKVKNRLGNVSL